METDRELDELVALEQLEQAIKMLDGLLYLTVLVEVIHHQRLVEVREDEDEY